MIIDFHTHIFPEKMAAATIAALEQKSNLTAATNGCVNGLLDAMSKTGVDCSVIMPVVTAPKQFDSINQFALRINEQYGMQSTLSTHSLISFGGIHPDNEDYKVKLRSLKDMGFAGIKLHPDYQGVFFDDIRYERIIAYATELDMLILVHAGIDIGLPEPVRCTPKMSEKVLKNTQTDKLILAHLGGWKLWDEVEELLVGSNAYFDIAFIQQFIEKEQFYRIVRNHGYDKILFATDSPWTEQGYAIKWLRESVLTEEVKEAIFWKNAAKLLKL